MTYYYDENTNISNPKYKVLSFCSKWDDYKIEKDNGIYFMYGYTKDKKEKELYSIEEYYSTEILFRLIKLFKDLDITKKPLKSAMNINSNITEKDLELLEKFCKANGMPYWGNGTNDVFRNDDYIFNKLNPTNQEKSYSFAEETILRDIIPLSYVNCFSVPVFIWYLRVLFKDFKNVVAYNDLGNDPGCMLLLDEKDKRDIEKIKILQKRDGHCCLQSPSLNPYTTYWSDKNMQLEPQTDNPMHLASYYLCIMLISQSMGGYIKKCETCGSLFLTSNSRTKYCRNPCTKENAYKKKKKIIAKNDYPLHHFDTTKHKK